MSHDLILLGTIHRDPQGPERLRQALSQRAWGLVSVEVSPYALSFRRRRGPELLALMESNLPRAAVQASLAGLAGLSLAEAQAHPALAWLKAYLAPPFEWQEARREAHRRGAACVACDFSGPSRELLASAPELVSVQNLALLLAGPAPAGAEMERRRAQALLSGGKGWPRLPAPEPQREAGLARRLERLLAACRRRGWPPLLHVGGWQHLLEDQSPPSLAQRLQVPPRARILI